MKYTFLILFCATLFTGFNQKKKQEYKPILNTTLEESFPNATAILLLNFKIGVEKFDYGSKLLRSTWFEYYRGINRYRCKYLLTIDDANTLDIKVIAIEVWISDKGYWTKSGEGIFSKKEENIRAAFAESIRITNKNVKLTKANQDWFFKDIAINSLFFENATDLAGDRWFDMYLKNQKINWSVAFVDIEKNSANNYNYKEIFYHSVPTRLKYDNNKFFIEKYTNSDSNTLTQKGKKIVITGYCKKLTYKNGVFHITLTDNLDSELPVETVKETKENTQKSILDVADDLKKLKELLDLGAISQEEYEKEKEKLLNGTK